MVDGQLARVVEDEPRPILELLRDEDLVSVESDVREQVAKLGKELQIESREIIIFVHRKFIIVAYKW
jgi:predicted translin family RNA/ssDNA-binding protein